MTTAVVIEANALVRRGILALLPQAGIRCVGSASTAIEGHRLVVHTGSRLAVVGNCADAKHLDIVERIAGVGECRSIVITAIADVVTAYQLYRAGAIGVSSPTATEDEFRQMFELAARGQRYVPANLLIDALDAPTRPLAESSRAYDLTTREREVLAVLALGHTNREIADRLCIGVETVKTHLNSIYAKFSVSRRGQAVSLAIRNQML